MGTAIKHPVPDRVKPSFVIFDMRELWRSDGGTAAAAPPPSGLATLPSVGAVPYSPHIIVD